MSETSASPEASGLGRKVLLATAAAALVYAAMAIYADVKALGEGLEHYAWSTFAIGLALATANYLLRFVRWHYYLNHLGIRGVPVVQSLRIFVAGFVMSVTPGKVGEVLKSVLLFEARQVPIERTAPIVVAERLTDLMALVLLAAAGSLAFEGGWIVASVGAVVVLVLWLGCAWRSLGEFMLGIAARLPLIGRFDAKLREAYEALRELTAPGPLAMATLLSVGSWGLECLSLLVIAQGFAGVHLTLQQATFAYASPTIVGALALLPGGLGVTEAGMVNLVETFGETSTPVAIAVTILVRLATLWWAVVLGAAALAWHRADMRGKKSTASVAGSPSPD